ncbi:MAG: hypothetical protein WDW38_009241 [Sanguina aurantia]
MNPKSLEGRRRLDGYVLSFGLQGLPYLEPGFGTIEEVPLTSSGCPLPSRAVCGVVHCITPTEWLGVQATEGVGSTRVGYQLIEVLVHLTDGRAVKALTLKAAALSLMKDSRNVLPSLRYLRLIQEGALFHSINPEYMAYLNAHPFFTLNPGWKAQAGKLAIIGLFFTMFSPVMWVFALQKLRAWASMFLATYGITLASHSKATVWQAYYGYGIFKTAWWLHNHVLQPLFGPGCCYKDAKDD